MHSHTCHLLPGSGRQPGCWWGSGVVGPSWWAAEAVAVFPRSAQLLVSHLQAVFRYGGVSLSSWLEALKISPFDLGVQGMPRFISPTLNLGMSYLLPTQASGKANVLFGFWLHCSRCCFSDSCYLPVGSPSSCFFPLGFHLFAVLLFSVRQSFASSFRALCVSLNSDPVHAFHSFTAFKKKSFNCD